jgi:hypothetical protein
MARVIVSLTMSLDGFSAGPNDDYEHQLGTRDGMKLFDWYSNGATSEHGDKRYDIAGGWNGTHLSTGIHVLVLTHHAPKSVPQAQAIDTPEATHLRYRFLQER